MPLLGLMAAEGAFKDVAAAPVSQLSHWQIAGTTPGEEKPIKDDPSLLAKAARAGLEELVARFAEVDTPYLAVPKPGAAPRYDDYAHLARLAEWGRTEKDT
jgi:ATP-dependent helicase/nuclease subunit B